MPKIKLEILVADAVAEEVVSAIVDAARTQTIGDGRIWVLPVDSIVRVRTGERGSDAI